MLVADNIVIKFDAFLVSIDKHMLLILDMLRNLKLLIYFDDGSLGSTYEDRQVKLVFKLVNLYLELLPSVYYTRYELRKIHRFSFYPSPTYVFT